MAAATQGTHLLHALCHDTAIQKGLKPRGEFKSRCCSMYSGRDIDTQFKKDTVI